MEDLLIGLDIGTSSVKAALFDGKGQCLARAASSVNVHSPQPGWVEQDPGEWWQAALMVLGRIMEGIDPARVAALGLSGQCPGHVLVTENRQAIGRAIIWQDQRAVRQAKWLREHVPPGKAQEWIGTDSLGDATCPPARLLWLKQNVPGDWERATAVLQPKDFIALQLTGMIATDRYSAYCLGHPDSGLYAPGYFDLLGIPLEKMPPMKMPTEVVGGISGWVATQVGMRKDTPVTIGTIDAYCDNLAGGISSPGRAVDVAGTSEIISLAIRGAVTSAGLYTARLGEAVTFLCSPTQAGGDTLRWLSHCFFPEAGRTTQYERLEAEAGSVQAGSEGLVFLPYLNGERAPLWDAGAKGAFIGLTFHHDRRHYCRAVYESIGYVVRHILETSEQAAGLKAGELVICGGGSRSAFWNQVKADILQRPVRPAAVTETGCLGAAILASVGSGLHPDMEQAGQSMIVLKDPILPDGRKADVYEQGYAAYRGYYPAMKAIFNQARWEEA